MQQDVKALEDPMEFYQLLLDLAHLKSFRFFTAGSRAEIECHEGSMLKYGLDTTTCDVDTMDYELDIYAFPLKQRVPETFRGSVLRILSDKHMHSGYVRLIQEADNTEYKHLFFQRRDNEQSHGPALLQNYSDFHKIDTEPPVSYFVKLHDRTTAVHCPYWPEEAHEFITRKRHHDCPSKSDIKQVAKYGCDFVGISHKLNNIRNNTEWRFSFSRAEYYIITNWSKNQRITYRALRFIYKYIEKVSLEKNGKTLLRTYYCKTLMMWACEQLPKEYWTDSSLADTLRKLLMTMAIWISLRTCKSYFIPDNNVMDHLMETDVSRDFFALYFISRAESNDWRAFAGGVIKCCTDDEDSFLYSRYHLNQPRWVYRSLLLVNRINNDGDFYRNLFSRNNTETIQTALTEELCDIYCGLGHHSEAARRVFQRQQNMEESVTAAEKSFLRATRLFQSTAHFVGYLEENEKRFFNAYCLKIDANKRISEAKYNADVNKIFDSLKEHDIFCEQSQAHNYPTQNIDDNLMGPPSNMVKDTLMNTGISFISMKYHDAQDSTEIHYNLDESGGVSPTVNTSFFIAKAYLANLYYTTRRDCKATVQACDDIIKLSDKSQMNFVFAHNSWRVLISTQLAAVFDEEIQTKLGFCALSVFLYSKGKRRSAHLAVCPVRFAHYLKLRCAEICSCKDQPSHLNRENLIKIFNDHSYFCARDQCYPVVLLILLQCCRIE